MKKLLPVLTVLFLIICSLNTAQAQSNEPSVPIAIHYEGGEEQLLKDIQSELNYPPSAKRNRIQGTVKVFVTLKPDGTMDSFRALSGPGAGCKEEAIRIIKTLNFNAPGYEANYQIPVKFSL